MITNDSPETMTVVVSAADWAMADRVIPAAEERSFIDDAVRLGTPAWMAKMAVWDADLAGSIPVSTTLNKTVSKTSPVRLSRARSLAARDAADGTCAGGYRLTGWDYTATYVTWSNDLLWSVPFKKRFCFNPTQRVVGSTYFNVGGPNFSSLGNNSWVHVRTSEEANRYIGWGGREKGSHRSNQSHTLKHCSVKWVICGGDQVFNYVITGYGDGSKTADWTQ